MATEIRNEAASLIQALLADEWIGTDGWINPDYETLVERALADERHATVERIRERISAPIPRDVRISGRLLNAHLVAILDQEAAR